MSSKYPNFKCILKNKEDFAPITSSTEKLKDFKQIRDQFKEEKQKLEKDESIKLQLQLESIKNNPIQPFSQPQLLKPQKQIEKFPSTYFSELKSLVLSQYNPKSQDFQSLILLISAMNQKLVLEKYDHHQFLCMIDVIKKQQDKLIYEQKQPPLSMKVLYYKDRQKVVQQLIEQKKRNNKIFKQILNNLQSDSEMDQLLRNQYRIIEQFNNTIITEDSLKSLSTRFLNSCYDQDRNVVKLKLEEIEGIRQRINSNAKELEIIEMQKKRLESEERENISQLAKSFRDKLYIF